MTAPNPLRGRRVLVAEDEYFIAAEVEDALRDDGAEVVGPVPTLAEALALARNAERLDLAVVDANLGGEMIWPVLDALADRGVPAILATGYDAGAVPPAYAHLTRCEKPVAPRDLLRALARHVPDPA